jgi:hypothetical protein
MRATQRRAGSKKPGRPPAIVHDLFSLASPFSLFVLLDGKVKAPPCVSSASFSP